MTKKIKIALFAVLSAIIAFCSICLLAPVGTDSYADDVGAVGDCGLVLTEITVPNYTASTKVYDPNGKQVTPKNTGVLRLLVVGEYTVVYSSGEERKILSLEKAPVSTLSLNSEFKQGLIAGEVVTLPELNVQNEYLTYLYYGVKVSLGETELADMKVNVGEPAIYSLPDAGEYTFTYYITNLEGKQESIQEQVNVISEKKIFLDQIKDSYELGQTIVVGYPYAFYEKKTIDVTVNVQGPFDMNQILRSESFTPEYPGTYTVNYSCEIEGQEITEQQTFEVVIPTVDFLVDKGNFTSDGLVDLPATAPKKGKAMLIRSSAISPSLYYRDIVDISQLTKEDNILEFFAYADGANYMKDFRVTFIDVYDESKSFTVHWELGQYGAENTYTKVAYADGEYGISNESKDLGLLRKQFGTTSYYTTFRPDEFKAQYMFNLQYDYAENALYLYTRDNAAPTQPKQLKLLGLNDSTVGLPSENLFKGFTTGEVYVKFEFGNNSNAGIYLTEIAGVSVENLDTRNFAHSLMTFVESLEDIPEGAVNYPYLIPQVKLSKLYSGNAGVTVTVKDADGNSVAVENDKFIPTTAGEYEICYSTEFVGEKVEKVIKVTINEQPNAIRVAVKPANITVKYGEFLSLPTISIRGGSGEVKTSIKVMQGETELTAELNGKYLIKTAQPVKLIVTAVDYIGYEVVQEVPVTVVENVTFNYAEGIKTVAKAGTTYNIPAFTATQFVNGGAEDISELKVFVDQTEITNGEYEVPQEGVDSFVLKYVAGSYEETYEIKVFANNVTSVVDYFATENVSAKHVTEAGIMFKANGNADIELPHKISADEMTFSFVIHDEFANFDQIVLTLTDSKFKDLAIQLIFKAYDKDANSIEVYSGDSFGVLFGVEKTYKDACGSPEIVSVYAGKTYTLFSIELDVKNAKIYNAETSVSVLSVSEYANGLAFNGFTDNACFMNLSVNGANDFDLVLAQISNNYFNYISDTLGWQDSDFIGPAITVDGDTNTQIATYNSQFTVASAKAFDVLSGYATVKVSVRHESGEMLLNKVSCKTENVITLNKYGTYSVVYEAQDYLGTKSTKTIMIKVKDDIAPVVTVSGNYASSYKVGNTIKILGFTASDVQGEVKTNIMVKDSALKITFVQVNGEFKFERAGKYEIIYRVVDSSNNVTRKVITVTVE